MEQPIDFVLPGDDDIDEFVDMEQFIVDNLTEIIESRQEFSRDGFIPASSFASGKISTPFELSQIIFDDPFRVVDTIDQLDFSFYQDITESCTYTLSSFKYSNGIDELLSPNPMRFWQTDGQAPHSLTARLDAQSHLAFLCILLDFDNDESYTPNELHVSTGHDLNALQLIKTIQLAPPPNGWLVIPLQNRSPASNEEHQTAFFLQMEIISSYSLGRDARVHGIRLYRQYNHRLPPTVNPHSFVQLIPYTTPELKISRRFR